MGVLIEKIIKAPLFKGLTKEEMEKVLSVAHEIKWSEGDTVIRVGEGKQEADVATVFG